MEITLPKMKSNGNPSKALFIPLPNSFLAVNHFLEKHVFMGTHQN